MLLNACLVIVSFLSFCIYCHPEWSEGTLLFFLRCFISFSMTGICCCHPDGTEGSLNLYTLRIITITDTISFCEDNVFYIKEVIFSNKISLRISIALLFFLAEVFVKRSNHQCLTYTAFMEQ